MHDCTYGGERPFIGNNALNNMNYNKRDIHINEKITGIW